METASCSKTNTETDPSITNEQLYTEHRGLRIPVSRAISRATPSIKPKAINKWLASLPLAHDVQSAIALTTFIEETNRINYPLAARFKALETLQTTVQSILSKFRKNSQSTQWPPSERNLKQYSINLALLNAVSTGYQICVVDLLEQTGNPSRRSLATCLQRALQALGQALMSSYTKYTSAPDKLWYNLHQLYLIARSFNCKDRMVKNIADLSPAQSSVAFEYKKQFLIQIAGPMRLLNSQIIELETLAEGWAHDLEIDVLSENDKAGGIFIVDPLHDGPPVRISQAKKLELDPLYSINLDPINERLLKILEAGKKGEPLPQIAGVTPSGTLVKLLLSDWLRSDKRIFKRSLKSGTLQAALGLTNSFNFIDHTNGNTAAQSPEANSPLALSELEGGQSSSFNKKSFDGNISDYATKAKQTNATSITLHSEKIHLHHCKIVNVSANGYCLQRQGSSPAKVQIGDVVALHEQDNAHALNSSVGVVRWLHFDSGNGLSFGIQVLSPIAQPLRTSFNNNGRKTYLPGLGLPEMPALQQSASILTSTHRYKSGDHIQINKAQQRINIQLGQRLERHQGYDRFKYKICVKK